MFQFSNQNSMQRRNFLRITAAGAATLLLHELTYAKGPQSRSINLPEKAWIQTNDEWFELKAISPEKFSYRDVDVTIKTNGNAEGGFVSSPTLFLSNVRLQWKHTLPSSAIFLGDHWERGYGDLQWKSKPDDIKNPWYVIINDEK